MALTKISERRLNEVDERLQKVIRLALSRYPANVQISEGKRTLEQQKKNLAKGVSQTLKSKHLDPDGNGPLKPTAVDVAIIKPNGKYSGVFEDYKKTICMSAFLFSLWFLLTSFNSKKTIKKICVVGRKTVLLLTLCRCCAILRINDDRTEDPSKISRRSPTAFCQERSGCYDNERYCRGFEKGTPYAVYLF